MKKPTLEFTPRTVHAILTEATAGDPTIIVPEENAPAVIEVAKKLQAWQWLVSTEQAHATSRKLRQRFADACITVDEVAPLIRGEIVEALQATHRHPVQQHDIERRPYFSEAIDVLDTLANAVTAAGENALLLHPNLRGALVNFWKVFAKPLADTFNKTVIRSGDNPAPIRNPLYNFVVAVVPGLTGERVTFDMVRTHFARKRPVNRARKRRQ